MRINSLTRGIPFLARCSHGPGRGVTVSVTLTPGSLVPKTDSSVSFGGRRRDPRLGLGGEGLFSGVVVSESVTPTRLLPDP